MKRPLFIVLATVCSVSSGVELICSGDINNKILIEKGSAYTGKKIWKERISVEITIEKINDISSIKNVFSKHLPAISMCFNKHSRDNFEDSCRQCQITDEEIRCYTTREEYFELLTVDRRTAIAQISATGNVLILGLSHQTEKDAKIKCQTSEKNKF
jgi:hypothetical protein